MLLTLDPQRTFRQVASRQRWGFPFPAKSALATPAAPLGGERQTVYGILAHLDTARFFAEAVAYHIRLGFVGKAGLISAY